MQLKVRLWSIFSLSILLISEHTENNKNKMYAFFAGGFSFTLYHSLKQHFSWNVDPQTIMIKVSCVNRLFCIEALPDNLQVYAT